MITARVSNTQQEQQAWKQWDSLNFYTSHRCTPEDLYPSEREFLPDVLPRVQTCLDFGCASGGFSGIMRQFNPKLRYTGVDIIPEFVRMARVRYPESRFLPVDGVHLPFCSRSFDLAHTSGVLHLNSAHREIVRELYRVSNRYLLADFRLTRGPERAGTCRIDFDSHNGRAPGAGPVLPYLVLNLDDHLAFLGKLDPPPRKIQVYGYSHKPSRMAQINLDLILMAFFLIEKGTDRGKTSDIVLDLQ